jgi:hypothetical protein
MRKFSEVLEDYLDERDKLNGDYYDNKFIGSRTDGRYRMIEYAQEMDAMIHGVDNDQN